MSRDTMNMGEDLGAQVIPAPPAVAPRRPGAPAPLRYSLRLIVVDVSAIGTSNAKPAADCELLQFDATPEMVRAGLERVAAAAQAAIKDLMG